MYIYIYIYVYIYIHIYQTNTVPSNHQHLDRQHDHWATAPVAIPAVPGRRPCRAMSDSTAAGVAKARHIESLAPEATRNVATCGHRSGLQEGYCISWVNTYIYYIYIYRCHTHNTHIHTYLCTCIYTYIYIIHTYIYIHIYVYIYIYIYYICIHRFHKLMSCIHRFHKLMSKTMLTA